MKPTDFFALNGDHEPSIKPECAILFHRATCVTDSYGGNDFLVSMHDFIVTDENKEPVIGAGRLLIKEDIESLFRSLLKMRNNKVELLPNNVVSISEGYIAWTVPDKVRPMLFNIGSAGIKKLNVPWPRLLIVANRQGKVAVSALKGRGRPSAKTRLYHAPLMNVGANGDVCTGTASVPKECGIADMTAWESVIFDTAFSHVNNNSTLTLEGKKEVDTAVHYRFWLSLSKKKEEVFPNPRLVPMRMTLERFVQVHSS